MHRLFGDGDKLEQMPALQRAAHLIVGENASRRETRNTVRSSVTLDTLTNCSTEGGPSFPSAYEREARRQAAYQNELSHANFELCGGEPRRVRSHADAKENLYALRALMNIDRDRMRRSSRALEHTGCLAELEGLGAQSARRPS